MWVVVAAVLGIQDVLVKEYLFKISKRDFLFYSMFVNLSIINLMKTSLVKVKRKVLNDVQNVDFMIIMHE